jgi:pilus assembly protein Flp/PilA
MFKKIRSLFGKEDGVSALEYALLAVLIALAIAVGAGFLGVQMNTTFGDATTTLKNVQ